MSLGFKSAMLLVWSDQVGPALAWRVGLKFSADFLLNVEMVGDLFWPRLNTVAFGLVVKRGRTGLPY